MRDYHINRIFGLLTIAIQSTILAQVDTLWTKLYDGNGFNDYGTSVIQTIDSNYVIAAVTAEDSSYCGDGWLIKTDREGNVLWDNKWQLSEYDDFNKIKQTSEGGFIIIGSTTSIGEGYSDIWVIKTDSGGNEEWSNTYGDSFIDYGFDVLVANDGGYVLLGAIDSISNFGREILLIKTNSSGVEEWSQTLGGGISTNGYSIVLASDGGFVIAGSLWTQDGIFIEVDIYIVKTDDLGNVEWTQTYGGEGPGGGHSIINTFDGGYVITGSERIEYYDDVFLLKVDSLGNEVWHYNFESTEHDRGSSVIQTEDSSFVIAGTIQQNGNRDLLIIKTDNNGNELWAKTFGGDENEQGNSIIQTKENEFVLTGYTESFSNGDADVWLLNVQEDSTFISDSTNYLDYFPLQVGNIWQYNIEGTDGFEPLFFDLVTISIEDENALSDSLILYSIRETRREIWNHEIRERQYYLKVYVLSNIIVAVNLNTMELPLGNCIFYDMSLDIGDTIEIDSSCNTTQYVDTTGYDTLDSLDGFTSHFKEYVTGSKKTTFFRNLGITHEYYEDSTYYPGWGMTYSYYERYLTGVRVNGIEYGTLLSTINDYNPIPDDFKLYQPYPNPFNPTTTIRFSVETLHAISLQIYDLTGRLLETLINEPLTPGEYEIIWNAGNLSSGVYFIQMQAGEFVQTKKMVLLK